MDRRGFLSLLMVSPVLASSYDDFQKQMYGEYTKYQQQLSEEFSEYIKILNEEFRLFKKSISQVWDTPEISSRHIWVQYSNDLKTRSIVDFANNTLKIESLGHDRLTSDEHIKRHLNHILKQDTKSAVENDTVLNNIEQRLKDLKFVIKGSIPSGDSILRLAFEDEDILSDLHSTRRRSIHAINQSENQIFRAFPARLQRVDKQEESALSSAQKGSELQQNSGVPAHHVVIKLPSNFLKKRANKQVPVVLERSNKYKVSFSTVMSVMHTESSFNPMALSDSAYGLMMINPETSGRTAHKKVYGEEKIITPTFLYNNINNVEFGSAYFNVMYYEYLKGITDPKSRLYCTIAAYNAGLGNIARVFTGKPILKKSFDEINAKSADTVLKTLQDQLPFEESKIYLTKVNERIPYYQK